MNDFRVGGEVMTDRVPPRHSGSLLRFCLPESGVESLWMVRCGRVAIRTLCRVKKGAPVLLGPLENP